MNQGHHEEFAYQESALESCATSHLAAMLKQRIPASSSSSTTSTSIASREETATGLSYFPGSLDDVGSQNCLLLFRQHARHYQRAHSPEDSQLEQIAPPHHPHNNNRQGAQAGHDDDTTLHYYRVGKRLRLFVGNVWFVYQHNLQKDHYAHTVTLNRFSDQHESEILPPPARPGDERSLQEMLWSSRDDSTSSSFDHHHHFGQENLLVHLTSSAVIRETAANLTVGQRRSFRRHLASSSSSSSTTTTEGYPSKILLLPSDDVEPFGSVEAMGSQLDGYLLNIQQNKENWGFFQVDPNQHRRRRKRRDAASRPNNFQRYLNWATTANPDGVPIVNPPIDQGVCGSCWAFTATGSLEASASRREAHNAYEQYMTLHGSGKGDDNKEAVVREQALQHAQQAERLAFDSLNLSIQELIDCDTEADQGCIGGNPLLSFFYIHRYGLVDWGSYPYIGMKSECKRTQTRRPLATVKSWGIISPDHEAHMELVLRYIGPIAGGINGGESTFLAYRGGVFDHPGCNQGANHAVLIVGYGEEEQPDGSTIKYWIARNSWGSGWGEDGYVRLKRGDGRKGTPGVCGIARSPTVAIGGVLLREQQQPDQHNNQQLGDGARGIPLYDLDDPVFNVCLQLWAQSGGDDCVRVAEWVNAKRAAILGSLGALCFLSALWILTSDYRQRRRRRKRRGHSSAHSSRRGTHHRTPRPPSTHPLTDSALFAEDPTSFTRPYATPSRPEFVNETSPLTRAPPESSLRSYVAEELSLGSGTIVATGTHVTGISSTIVVLESPPPEASALSKGSVKRASGVLGSPTTI